MKPSCCDKPATPYQKIIGGHSIEAGFRCKKCGRIRIPFMDWTTSPHMEAMPAIRLAGIEFDETLTKTN